MYLASIIQHRKERRTGVSEVAKGITRSAKAKFVNSLVQNKKIQPKVLKDLPLKTVCEIAEKCDHDLYAQCKSFLTKQATQEIGNAKETTKKSSYFSFFFVSKHLATTVLVYVRVRTRCKQYLLENVKQGKNWKKEDNKTPFCCPACGDVPLCRLTDLAMSCWAKWHKQIHGFSQKLC